MPGLRGRFDQKGASREPVYLPVLVEDTLVIFGDPPAAITTAIITGTGSSAA